MTTAAKKKKKTLPKLAGRYRIRVRRMGMKRTRSFRVRISPFKRRKKGRR